jgi:hypothetical protein
VGRVDVVCIGGIGIRSTTCIGWGGFSISGGICIVGICTTVEVGVVATVQVVCTSVVCAVVANDAIAVEVWRMRRMRTTVGSSNLFFFTLYCPNSSVSSAINDNRF